MAQDLPEKMHLQANGISVAFAVADNATNFGREFACHYLIGIEQEDPVISQSQRVHCPLPLLGPTTRIQKLDYLCAMGLSDGDGIVSALGIDDIDFAEFRERIKTPRKIAGLIAGRDDHADAEQVRRDARQGKPRL